MAKKQPKPEVEAVGLPEADEPLEPEANEPPAPEPPEPEPPKRNDQPKSVTVELPMGEHGGGYLTRHVEAQLDEPQRLTLRRLLEGLKAANEKLASGKRVETNADAVKWVLEEVGAAAEKKQADAG